MVASFFLLVCGSFFASPILQYSMGKGMMLTMMQLVVCQEEEEKEEERLNSILRDNQIITSKVTIEYG